MKGEYGGEDGGLWREKTERGTAAPATVVNDDGGPVAPVEGLKLLGEELVCTGVYQNVHLMLDIKGYCHRATCVGSRRNDTNLFLVGEMRVGEIRNETTPVWNGRSVGAGR